MSVLSDMFVQDKIIPGLPLRQHGLGPHDKQHQSDLRLPEDAYKLR